MDQSQPRNDPDVLRKVEDARSLSEGREPPYVEARYSEHYRISEEELGWIDQRVEVLQRLVRIEKTIQDLPEPTRAVLRARRLEALEYEEIADRLSLSLSEVDLAMARALDAVARSMSLTAGQAS